MPTIRTARPARPASPPTRAAGLSASRRGYDRRHRKARAAELLDHPLCERCSGAWGEHLHHRDRDPFNREPANLEVLCGPCHRDEHRR